MQSHLLLLVLGLLGFYRTAVCSCVIVPAPLGRENDTGGFRQIYKVTGAPPLKFLTSCVGTEVRDTLWEQDMQK